MGFAEKKVELLKIVADADEDMTGTLIAVAKEYAAGRTKLSQQEIDFFEKRASDFYSSGEKGITAEESITRLREKLT